MLHKPVFLLAHVLDCEHEHLGAHFILLKW